MLEDPRLQMEERNIQHAIIGDVMNRLPEILQSLTKSRLSSLAAANQISGRSKMKKEELADALSAYLTDPEQLRPIVMATDADEWALLEKVMNEPSIQDNTLPFGHYANFLERGLVFSFFNEGKLHVLMPEEIKAAASQIGLSELKKSTARSRKFTIISPPRLICMALSSWTSLFKYIIRSMKSRSPKRSLRLAQARWAIADKTSFWRATFCTTD